MSKNPEAFLHDANSRNDEKLLKLRAKFGIEGYGFYYLLLEMLLQADNSELELEYSYIAFALNFDAKKVEAILSYMIDLGLFIKDGKNFFSSGLKNRVQAFEKKREIYKANANARYKKDESKEVVKQVESNCTAIAEQSDCKSNITNTNTNSKTNLNLKKQSVKIPGFRDGCEKHEDHVWLKPEELEKLNSEFSPVEVHKKILSLDSQIENGVKLYVGYANHYKVIRNWLTSDNQKPPGLIPKPGTYLPRQTNFDRNMAILGVKI